MAKCKAIQLASVGIGQWRKGALYLHIRLLPNAAERGQAAAKRAPIAAGMAEMRRTGRMAVQKVPIRVKFTTINRTHWMDDIIN